MYTLGRPLRSRCITSSLYVPEAVKMVPETVTCDIIAIGWIWDMLTFQSHAVSEPNGLPEAFWMLFRYVSRIGKIDVSKSFTAMRNFMKFPWDSHQTPGMKLPNQSKSCDKILTSWGAELHAAFNLGNKARSHFSGAGIFNSICWQCQDTGAAAGLCCKHPASRRRLTVWQSVVDWFWTIC